MKPRTLLALLAALTLAGCADESPERRIASAKAYLQKNDTKSAVIEIKNALQTNPDLGEARFLLGATLLKDGNPVAAEVELRKARATNFPDGQVVPELARATLMLGQAKKVVDEFGSVKLGKPTADANLQTTLAAAYAMLGKAEQAQAALDAALAADGKYAQALLVSARQKAGARDFDGAAAVVEGVIGREPTNSDAWKMKGDLLVYAKNKPDEALAAYQKAVQADSAYMPGHAAIITLLMQLGKLDEAAKQIEQLKKLAPKSPQTRFFEAQLAYQKKDFKLARDLSQQLVQQVPNNARVLQLAGAVELQLGAPGQAEIYLSKAVQVAPELALARRLLIVTYLRSGQSAKALTALNAATGKDGVEPALYSLAGEVYLQNGDAKKAEEYFALALKLDPENARKRTALAVTHLAGGQASSALDELQSIAASDPSTTADLALISAQLRRQEFDKALVAIDKLEAKQPDKPIAANLRGRVQLALKDTGAARKSFERALSIDPNFFAAAASLAALDMADKKPDEAKKRFQALLAKNPKNGQALLALAQVAAVNGAGKDEVAALLAKAVEANPMEIAPRLLLIDHFIRNNDYKQALPIAQAAVSSLPASPELLGALGRAQQVSGDLNQAIATYSKLIALQPLSPFPYTRMAEAKMANKDVEGASLNLRKALDIKSDYLDAQLKLIMLASAAKNYQGALKIVRDIKDQRPKDPVGFALAGDIAAAQKNWNLAAEEFRSGLQRAALPTLAVKLYSVLESSNNATEARRFLVSWMRDNPKDTVLLSHLGALSISRKNYVSAEEYYQTVLRIQPNNIMALNNLAWVTGQLGKDGSIHYAEMANKLAPNEPPIMDTLAILLAQKREYVKAIELQKKALEIRPLMLD